MLQKGEDLHSDRSITVIATVTDLLKCEVVKFEKLIPCVWLCSIKCQSFSLSIEMIFVREEFSSLVRNSARLM